MVWGVTMRKWIVIVLVHLVVVGLYLWARGADTPVRIQRVGERWTLQVANAPASEFSAPALSLDSVCLQIIEDTAYTQVWNEPGWSRLMIRGTDGSVFDAPLRRLTGAHWRVNWRGELVPQQEATRWNRLEPACLDVRLGGDFELTVHARRARVFRIDLKQSKIPAQLEVRVRTLQKDYECHLIHDGERRMLVGRRLEPDTLYCLKDAAWKVFSAYFSALVLAGLVAAGGTFITWIAGLFGEAGSSGATGTAKTVAAWVLCVLVSAAWAGGFLWFVYRTFADRGLPNLAASVVRDFGVWGIGFFVAILFGALFALVLRLSSTLVARHAVPEMQVVPPDWVSVFLVCAATFLVSAAGAKYLMREVPHVQDSVAYLFQGKILAAGRLWAPAPEYPEFFEFQFLRMEPEKNRWYSVYTPGHPAMLALGVWAGRPWLVAPVLAALTVLVVYKTGRMVYGPAAGLAGASLMMVSPWVLFMSSSFMSHPTALFFVALFFYLALKAERGGHWATALAAGAAWGMLMLARPLTAPAAGLPVAVYYGVLLARRARLWGKALWMAVGAVLFVFLLLAYNWAFTGSPFLSPRGAYGIGFQLVRPETFSYWLAIAEVNLAMFLMQLFGWPMFTLALALAALLWARQRETWVLASYCVAMFIAYSPVPYHFHLFGARFWYEAVFAVMVLSGAGVVGLSRMGESVVSLLVRQRGIARGGAPQVATVAMVVAVMMIYGVRNFVPIYLPRLNAYNGITGKERMLLKEHKLSNAIVFAETRNPNDWQELGRILWVNDPVLERGAVIAARDLGATRNALLAALYPDRRAYLLTRSEPLELRLVDYGVDAADRGQKVEYRMDASLVRKFERIKGLAVGPDGDVFVLDYNRGEVTRFSPDGKFLMQWGRRGRGSGEFYDASDLAVSMDGTVYVLDGWNKRLVKFSAAGRFLGNIEVELFGARGICIAPDGRFYIADTGTGLLKILDRDGRLISSVGGRGSAPGQMIEPVGVAVSTDGEVFVADTGNHRIQVFDLSGRFMRSWPVELWRSGVIDGYIAVDPEGVIWASDPGAGIVVRYSRSGNVLEILEGPRPGERFSNPTGIAIDAERESVFITNMSGGRISVMPFRREARTPGNASGSDLESRIAGGASEL